MKKTTYLLIFIVLSCHPKESIDHLLVAYNVLIPNSNDNYDIHVIDLQTKRIINLSNSPAIEWLYHSYKNKLYYISDAGNEKRKYHFYEMNSDGSAKRKVYDKLVADSWISSRLNGTEFLVTRLDSIGKSFVLIDYEGNEIKQIFKNDTAYYNDPCFSPDGQLIAFRYRPHKNKADRYHDEIWIMDLDGVIKERISYYPPNDHSFVNDGYHAGPPVWTSKNNLISYISLQDKNYSIFCVSMTDRSQYQIGIDTINEGWHSWSPKNEYLVYDFSDTEWNQFDLAISEESGNSKIILTQDSIVQQAPLFVEKSTDTIF